MKRLVLLFSCLVWTFTVQAGEHCKEAFVDSIAGASYHIPFESNKVYNANDFQKFHYRDDEVVFSIFSNRNPKRKNYSQRDLYRFIEDRSLGECLTTSKLQTQHQMAESHFFKQGNTYHLVLLIPTYHSATYFIESRLDSTGFQSPQIFQNGIYEHHIYDNRFAQSAPWWIYAIFILIICLASIFGESAHFNWFWTIVFMCSLMTACAFTSLFFTGEVNILLSILVGITGLLVSPSSFIRSFVNQLLLKG